MAQLDFCFDEIANSEKPDFGKKEILDDQIEELLSKIGMGGSDWDENIEGRFIFWLHIHVLQDTVNVLSDTKSGKMLRREAAEWLFSESKIGFSFFSIAKILGADPGELLSKILEMPKVRNGLRGVLH